MVRSGEIAKPACKWPTGAKKTDKLALRLGIDDLKGSSGWLDHFKVRHGISCHKIVGKSVSVDPKSVSEWLPLLQNVLSRYQPRDVYNAKLGMLYNLMPDRILAVKGDVCKGTKRSKEHLTALLCCNMDGSDKMKPLVICKLKKHRGFRGNILKCNYDFNKKAWMTSAVFTMWLHCFVAKMGAANRKVILFVDNCPAHPELDNIRNIELVFLPKNTTSMLQPLDKWDVFSALEAIVTSWRAVQQKTIANCFRHAHFVTTVDKEAAIQVLLTATSSEDPDDPPPVDTEPQPDPLTVPVGLYDCHSAMSLSQQTITSQFGVPSTMQMMSRGSRSRVVKNMGRVKQKNLLKFPQRETYSKPGLSMPVLRGHGANEEMWLHFTHLSVFVEQTLVKKKQTTIIKDFFKK
ncbi:hypothetical protein PR048_008128 [Dryococelus australis]|uniref:DDE-1 domain-containing protein n=1 Tax=Dryococelus australis TaxID=614101 RepID=A0ABQ9HX07_9NEOP|nr:hypothetical protein PR048_008128 [Dryococelus australis]